MSFYNTNKESGEELLKSSKKSSRQKIVIYDLFLLVNEPMSPSMVYTALNQKWPITSVRRAMTDLTDDGLLNKTEETATGLYGKKEHLWSLPEKTPKPKHSTVPALLFDF